MNQSQLKSAAAFFKEPELLKAFALVCLDGTARQQILGITQRHYADQVLAANWYNNLRAELVNCRRLIPKKEYSAVMNEAGKLFGDMTKHVK